MIDHELGPPDESQNETKSGLIQAWINPLQILEIDQPWASATSEARLTPGVFLKFLCTPGVPSDEESLRNRYKQISAERSRLFVVPTDPRILHTLVWPLRHAKAAFIVGNYLATISLAGIVAEMTALLLFDIAVTVTNTGLASKEIQQGLFGSTFEKLGQERRIKVLSALNLISKEEVDAFGSIRVIRRQHMHLSSASGDDKAIACDAVKIFDDAVFLVVKALGSGVAAGGECVFKAELLQYLASINPDSETSKRRPDAGAGQ
jgi:hypothetical protein